MILKSLKVAPFGGLNPGAFVEKFGPDITVIHGPNGIGKSTLFRALTYALYQRSNVTAQEARAQIVPRGCDVAPRVEVVFELDGTTWKLSKQWFKKADAELARLEKDTFVVQAQGSAAEDSLRDLLGSGGNQRGLAGTAFRGIGEILLVDQGDVRLEGVSDLARDRLRVVIDQVGTTQGAHEVLSAIEKKYDEVFGKTGLRERSDASHFAEDVRGLEARRDDLRGRINEATALEQRLAALAGDSPARVQEEIEKLESELKAAYGRQIEAVKHRARSDALGKEAHALGEESERLRAACADLRQHRATRDRLGREIEVGEARWRDANEAHKSAARLEHEAGEKLQAAYGAGRLLSDRERAVRDARDAYELARRLPDLEERVTRHSELCDRIGEASKKVAARRRPTEPEVAGLRTAFQLVRELERAAELLDLRISVTSESAIAVECGAERLQLGANESRDVVSGGEPEIRIPGVARISIRAPGGVERARVLQDLAEARRKADAEALRFGVADLESAEALARERVEFDASLQGLTATRGGLFKDEKSAKAAQVEVGTSRAALAELFDRRPEWKGVAPELATLAAEEQALEKERQHAGNTQNACAELLESRKENAKGAREELERREAALQGLKRDLATAAGRIETLEKDGLSDEDRAKLLAQAEARKAEVSRELEATTAALDALRDPDATIQRLGQEKRAKEAQQRLDEETRIRLSEQLEQLRAKGHWKEIADVEIELLAKSEALERARLDADALKLLRDVLVREQTAAVEAAVRPVADRVTRMARFLFGAGSKATFSEQLAPQALGSDGSEIPVGLLSAGTQDQLAVLTRIALGELYAEKCGRHAFVLDDPLVNCDRDRRGRLLELLAASRSLQVVIFTCSPELYQGLPEARTVFLAMDEAKLRISRPASMTA